jgi:16S rRNA (guanine527-N7)-methyltransferase
MSLRPETRRAARRPAPALGPEAPIAAERLQALAAELGLALSDAQCAALLAYAQLLRRWNRVHNLTAIDSPAQLLSHHILDSLSIAVPLASIVRMRGIVPARADPARAGASFLDAGSGAGLPGIPLAIAWPGWRAHFVDAVGKKCAFLRQACVELGLAGATVHHARLESLRLEPQPLIVARAFASLKDFVALTRPLLATGGIWAAMKGRNPLAEIRELPPGIEVLDTVTLRVPTLQEQRHLVVLAQAADAPGAS